MANFTLRPTFSLINSGSTPTAPNSNWIDPAGSLPSRLNPTTGIAHRYLVVPRGSLLYVMCRPDTGTELSPDTALGGNLFVPYWAEYPSLYAKPALVQETGMSSVIMIRFTTPGHYLLGVFRNNGGQQLLHITCE
jgi:hypothetical protein